MMPPALSAPARRRAAFGYSGLLMASAALRASLRRSSPLHDGGGTPRGRRGGTAPGGDNATTEEPPERGHGHQGPGMHAGHALALGAWALSVGAFLTTNYYRATSPFPGFLADVDVRTWALVHAVSGMLFAGGILTTAFVEWLVISKGSEPVKDFWFTTATKAEAAVVLPGLTGSMISGVAQSWILYRCPLQYAPLHVKLPVHILLLFGVWWLVTDLATRDAAGDESKQMKRLGSNAVSCLLVLALYFVMVLKP